MTQQPHEPGAGRDEETIEQFLERLVNGEPISRRTVLRRFAAAGLTAGAATSFLAACGGVSGTKKSGHDRRHREREPPEGVVQQGRLLELAAVHRPEGHPGLGEAVRRQDALPRGLQRQRGVLRQGPPGARGGPRHRPRPRHADRLDGRALDRLRLRDADRQEERPEREEPAGQPQAPAVRQEPRLHAAVAVRHHGHRLQPEEDRAQAHERQGPLRPGVQGPGVDVHGVAGHRRARAARRRQEPDDGDEGRLLGGDRQDRRGEQEGPDPQVHRERLHEGPGGREPLGLRRLVGRPRAAEGRQPEPRVPRARGGRDDVVGQHADPAEAVDRLRRRDVHELRLRPAGRGRRSPRT